MQTRWRSGSMPGGSGKIGTGITKWFRNRYHKVVPKPLKPRYHKVVLQGRVTKWSHYLYLGVGAGDEAGSVPDPEQLARVKDRLVPRKYKLPHSKQQDAGPAAAA